MFKFLRDRRRAALSRRPMPTSWEPIIARKLPWMERLPGEERARALEHLKVFLWEKHWFGAKGLEVTTLMKVVISGQAARLARNLGLDAYDRLTEIVIYPTHYMHPDGDDVVYGEAHHWGTVVLSWDAVSEGVAHPRDGHDTTLHELAHVLDVADGWFDGTPPLHRGRDYKEWWAALGRAYKRLRADPERGVVRAYGATNAAEFFAVSTEAFFERPKKLRRDDPALYAALARFYKTDEASLTP